MAATEQQLWVFTGSGLWRTLSEVLEDREIRQVEFDPDDELVVGTDRGLYRWSDLGIKGQCVSTEISRCVQNDRFRMTLTWRDFEGRTGRGRWVDIASSESGMGWFFSANNWEVLAKVINGCAFNGSYWVFLAATTNVEFTLTVTDTQTGAVKTYTNPLGASAQAVTDIGAFLGCS